jgi:hypothetical protein
MLNLSVFLKSVIVLTFASAWLNSCKTTEIPEEPQPAAFTDYQTAETWIKENHNAETITPQSSLIKKIEYYPAINGGYLIIYLHRGKAPTLLYQNINQQLWDAFKNAASKGKFYNAKILGNKNFILVVK